MLAHRGELLGLEESLTHVPLLQHRDVRPDQRLAAPRGERVGAFERDKLTVDLRVGGTCLLACSCVAPHVSRRDLRRPPAAEVRQEVQVDPALQVGERLPLADR